MYAPKDLLGRELHIGDHVVFHNVIYIVKSIPDVKIRGEYQQIGIMLLHPHKTTRAVKKRAGLCCLIPGEDIVAWKLREGIL